MAQTVPPTEDSYQFVLRRYDRQPYLDLTLNTYLEVVVSRDIMLDRRRAPTLFLRTESARDRALKLGWLDETAKWNARPKWADPWVVDAAMPDVEPITRKVVSYLLVAQKWVDMETVASETGLGMDLVRAACQAQNRQKGSRLIATMGPTIAATEHAKKLVRGELVKPAEEIAPVAAPAEAQAAV